MHEVCNFCIRLVVIFQVYFDLVEMTFHFVTIHFVNIFS